MDTHTHVRYFVIVAPWRNEPGVQAALHYARNNVWQWVPIRANTDTRSIGFRWMLSDLQAGEMSSTFRFLNTVPALAENAVYVDFDQAHLCGVRSDASIGPVEADLDTLLHTATRGIMSPPVIVYPARVRWLFRVRRWIQRMLSRQ